jgi:hypothetical protein
MRMAQELGVLAPPQVDVLVSGLLSERVRLGPFATALVWITPHEEGTIPASPRWLETTREGGNVVLRWSPSIEPSFWSYEVERARGNAGAVIVSPLPLRAAMWVDTAVPPEAARYSIRAVTASGLASARAWSGPV